jgi:hypothetical protein
VSYNKFATLINGYLADDKIENTSVDANEQFGPEDDLIAAGPFPTADDNKRIFIRWFGDAPNIKGIVMLGYIELISETEMRCMLLEALE